MLDSVEHPAPVMTSSLSLLPMNDASDAISSAVAGSQSGTVLGRRRPYPAREAVAKTCVSFDEGLASAALVDVFSRRKPKFARALRWKLVEEAVAAMALAAMALAAIASRSGKAPQDGMSWQNILSLRRDVDILKSVR